MIDTPTKKDEMLSAVLMISVCIVFMLGMVLWPYMPKDDKYLSKLYYLTISSVMYLLCVIVFIVANTRWLKVASCLGIGVFSVNLYIEMFLDPLHWTAWSWGLIIIVSLNMFLSVILLSKLKKKNKK